MKIDLIPNSRYFNQYLSFFKAAPLRLISVQRCTILTVAPLFVSTILAT